MSKRKPVVGETLFMLNIGDNARRRECHLRTVEVISVGRKYFIVSEDVYKDRPHMHVKFTIDTWVQSTDYSAGWCLYESEQEYFDEKERGEMIKMLRDLFHRYSGNLKDLTIASLRKIKDIVESELSNNGG